MREETLREVEQFLYRECRLLDERRFHEWLALLTDDGGWLDLVRAIGYPQEFVERWRRASETVPDIPNVNDVLQRIPPAK